MASLIIRTGKFRGKRLAIPFRRIILGRDEGCDIRLVSSEISRQHCALQATAAGITVCDLGSSNGTLVNGVTIVGETVLRPGDRLRVGPIEFAVSLPRVIDCSPALDNDIAEWLTEGDTKHGTSPTPETTILKAAALPNSPAAPPPPKKTFQSIAEEAQEIIRRHLELQAAEQQEG